MNTQNRAQGDSKPYACCSFWFDEQAFKAYFELFTKPSYSYFGRALMISGVLRILLFVGLFLLVLWLASGDYLGSIVPILLCVVLIGTGVWALAYGLYLASGAKRPQWSNDEWEGRIQESSDWLAERDLNFSSPISPTAIHTPSLLLMLVFPEVLWADEPFWLYNTTPFLKKKFPARTDAFAQPIPYTVYFYDEGIYVTNGSSGFRFVTDYRVLHLPEEDMKKWPDFAMLRRRDVLYSHQVILKKDEFIFGSWEMVRSKIQKAVDSLDDFDIKRKNNIEIANDDPFGFLPESIEEL